MTFKPSTYAYGCNSTQNFGLSTISIDFNVGRGGGFTDLGGFTYINGKYFTGLGNSPKDIEIPKSDAEKIINKNGVEILKIKRTVTYIPASDGEPARPPIYYPGDDEIGALINTKNDIFPGFYVKMDLKDGLTEEDFDQILSTFKFTP